MYGAPQFVAAMLGAQAGGVILQALADVRLFDGVDAATLDRIESRSRTFESRDKARIFSQSTPADAVYAILVGGRVRIGTAGRGNKNLMVEVLGAGDVFGEVGVLDGGTRSADAFAEGRVRLMRISASVFLDALGESPRLGFNLSRMLAARLRRTFTLFEDATFETVEARFARQILYLARRDGRTTEQGMQLAGRFRQGDLADLLGTTNRSIITILNAWRTDGLVAYDTVRARLTITDEAGLMARIAAERETV